MNCITTTKILYQLLFITSNRIFSEEGRRLQNRLGRDQWQQGCQHSLNTSWMNIGVYDLSKLHCACASSTKMEHETWDKWNVGTNYIGARHNISPTRDWLPNMHSLHLLAPNVFSLTVLCLFGLGFILTDVS